MLPLLLTLLFLASTLGHPVIPDDIDLDDETGIEDEDYLVNFMLFTRNNSAKFQLLQSTHEDSITNSNFDGSKPTKLVIHGWLREFDSPMGFNLRDAFLARYDCNVILVDWSKDSKRNYLSSRLSVARVGRVVARLVQELWKHGSSPNRTHLLGHSLGAHVAGVAGSTLNGTAARVTGLDPAGPLFSKRLSARLKPDSGQFVDVIHTCGHVLGFTPPLGTADFYPNKGTFEQPGCGFDYKGTCSHRRAYEYYTESISSSGFLALPCDSWEAFLKGQCSSPPTLMGEDCPSTAKGRYYLRTKEMSPYAMGDNFAERSSTSDHLIATLAVVQLALALTLVL